MGKPQSTGNLVNALAQDSSNNIGIGGAANASFKLRVTGSSAGDSVYAIGDGASSGGALKIKQYASSAANEDGYSTISTLNTGVFYFTSASTSPNFKNFVLNPSGLTDNTLRTFTLPDASGTIALTSNLSAYLPLTGGTLTGALSGTSGTFSGNMAIGGSTITDANMLNVIGNQSSVNIGLVLNNTNATYPKIYAIQNVNNNLVFYDYSASSPRLTIANTGAATFASSISATSATFSSTLTGTNAIFSSRLGVGISSDQTYASLFVGGDITTGVNQYAIITDPQLSGTSNSYALFANARIKTSTAVTNAFGVYIPSAEKLSGASITNNYALYIANQTSGSSTNYSIYSSGGLNYFGGNVGIGTSPSSRLHVASATESIITNEVISGGQYALYRLKNGSYTVDAGVDNSGLYFEGSTGATRFFGGGSERMRITSGGKGELLVGTSSASGWSNANRGLLELNGGSSGSALFGLKINDVQRAYFYHNNSNLYIENMLAGASIYVISISGGVYLAANATSWTSNSDERLKNINSNIDNALSKLMTLRAVNFSWKTDETNKENLGLIAQDVEKVFPQVIDKNKLPSKPDKEQTDETEYLGVRYQELVPVLIAAIQEQQAQIEELTQKVNALENK
jgi:hypothetical protein